jgi:hypothetical protein
VARQLVTDGWLVGDRHNLLGGGDLVAARHRGDRHDIWLVEVKSTAGGPYERFLPADRLAMLEVAWRTGAQAWLAWWPPKGARGNPRGELQWIPSWHWPAILNTTTTQEASA